MTGYIASMQKYETAIVRLNERAQVIYLFSYFSSDVTKSACIYYLISIIISRISSRVIHPQFVSSHTDVYVIFGKREVNPIISLWLKTFQKCNPTDFKFYLGKVKR